ncbi:MAG: hypothetical protein E6G09_09645, partial [Actinobacteria bacterium]
RREAPRARRSSRRSDRGLTTTNPTIGCCWDADRLDLGRVGIEPDPELMSTIAGPERALRIVGLLEPEPAALSP